MHATRAATASGNVTAAFSREQGMLAAVGLPAGQAAAGTVLPDTGLLDPYAAATTLYAVTGDSTAVLVFYRGCLVPVLQHRPVRLSGGPAPAAHRTRRPAGRDQPQKPDGSLTMQQKHNLVFTVVCDPGNVIARRLGILTQPSPEAGPPSFGWD
jgi:hypothetical protein